MPSDPDWMLAARQVFYLYEDSSDCHISGKIIFGTTIAALCWHDHCGTLLLCYLDSTKNSRECSNAQKQCIEKLSPQARFH